MSNSDDTRAHNLRETVDEQRSTIAAMEAERNALKAHFYIRTDDGKPLACSDCGDLLVLVRVGESPSVAMCPRCVLSRATKAEAAERHLTERIHGTGPGGGLVGALAKAERIAVLEAERAALEVGAAHARAIAAEEARDASRAEEDQMRQALAASEAGAAALRETLEHLRETEGPCGPDCACVCCVALANPAGAALLERLRLAEEERDWGAATTKALLPYQYRWGRLLRDRWKARIEALEGVLFDGSRPLPLDRESLGRTVREAWVRWAEKCGSPKDSWLVPWERLSEFDREADRQIGEAVARWTLIHDAARAALAGKGGTNGR